VAEENEMQPTIRSYMHLEIGWTICFLWLAAPRGRNLE
jgi:hypothetical protein